MKTVLLAGPSAGGKSTLARALCPAGQGPYISTSGYLRSLVGGDVHPNVLFAAGQELDGRDHTWLFKLTQRRPYGVIYGSVSGAAVVDAIRSNPQLSQFRRPDVVLVNVVANPEDVAARHRYRNTLPPIQKDYLFPEPDVTWNSSVSSLASALASVNTARGFGYADAIIGGQYGSEGKGKLAALLAPNYDVLVRSGGPNAGHWVRNDGGTDFCFHQVPSGSMVNRKARCYIAAGATIDPVAFMDEARRADVAGRIWVDNNTVLIDEGDRTRESLRLVDVIGSTASGVGSATSRRVLRGMDGPDFQVNLASDNLILRSLTRDVVSRLDEEFTIGSRILVEGTQGSALSLYHGPYPYVTSRDTNVAGLLSECGIAPGRLRDVWMVVRSHPIRVGGNSGPMRGELTWEEMAGKTGRELSDLKSSELTSTTRRQRRIGQFDSDQFSRACNLNRPTRLFLTFADYISPSTSQCRSWSGLSPEVLAFVATLEKEAGCPVAGVSTGKYQTDVAWRPGYQPAAL